MRRITDELTKITNEVNQDNNDLFQQSSGTQNNINNAISEWVEETKKGLENNPFRDDYKKFDYWQRKFKFNIVDNPEDIINDYDNFTTKNDIPNKKDFWIESLNKSEKQEINENYNTGFNIQFPKVIESKPYIKLDQSDNTGFNFQLSKVIEKKQQEWEKNYNATLKLLFSKWESQLNDLKEKWELKELANRRVKFLKELNEWLSQIKQLMESLQSLGLDPGEWLSFDSGSLQNQDIEQLKTWAEYLKNDKGAKEICELLGRITKAEQSAKIEKIKTTKIIHTPIIDTTSKEDIVGLKTSNDIEHIIPSELALLSDPDTELFFNLKFLEKRLLSFDMQGISLAQEEQEIEIEQSVTEDDKKGPMILCVDTSGSMHGAPENIAKAMALYLATKAKAESRACYLINFSTDIETYELTENKGISHLISFLQKSFHGGTDISPALSHTLEIMQTENYKKSDVLIISDFIMSSLPEDILIKMTEQRTEGNIFNSLVVGNLHMTDPMKTIFDNEWIYNPNNSKIIELVNFQEKLKI